MKSHELTNAYRKTKIKEIVSKLKCLDTKEITLILKLCENKINERRLKEIRNDKS